LPTAAHRVAKAIAMESRGKTGGDNMAFHKVKELGWVSFWIAFIIFLFAIFIPTVNRSLNL
jgi:hypothetical protein